VKVFETATGVTTFEVDQTIQAHSVAFSRDDDMLVCGFRDGTVRVWDVQRSGLIQSFEGHIVQKVLLVAFSPCGTMIVGSYLAMVTRLFKYGVCCLVIANTFWRTTLTWCLLSAGLG
jgi:WD40 repeat protein